MKTYRRDEIENKHSQSSLFDSILTKSPKEFRHKIQYS